MALIKEEIKKAIDEIKQNRKEDSVLSTKELEILFLEALLMEELVDND